MSIDAAFQRFREANPVPNPSALRERPVDPGVFLVSTQQRSKHMQSTADRIELTPQGGSPKFRPAFGVAAVLIAVLIGAGLLASVRSSDNASAGLERRAALIGEQARVYSEGDFDRWVSYYTGDATLWNGFSPEGPDLEVLFPVSVAANERWMITGLCQARHGNEVTCPMRQSDDLHGPAGLALDAVFTFTFNEEDKITAVRLDTGLPTHFAQWNTFDVRFVRWLEAAHPEVELVTVVQANDSGVMMTAESVVAALQYVDEFVDQSDDYPVEPETP
jgi:hypothetical protein